MNITLASIFTNSTPYLRRYFAQVVALSDALYDRGDKLTCLWGEGDSTDHTRAMLDAMRWRLNSQVVDVTHGGEIFGSVERAERFRQLAGVGRKLFAALPADAEVVLYVESDLIWSPATALGLIDGVGPDVAAIAPPILLNRAHWPNDTWYDTWAFRAGGVHFTHRPPYHPWNDGRSLLELESAGSMLAIDAGYARRAAQTYDERVLMGLCEDIRKQGGRICFDPTLPPAIHE